MSLVRQFGPLENGGKCEHPSPCETEAVARVPNPVEIGSAGRELYPFHLALWADTRGDEETLRELDVADRRARNRWLRLDAVPPRLDREVVWTRLGIDHRGLAHFVHNRRRRRDSADRVVLADCRLELVEAFDVPAHVGLNGWVDHVDRRRGRVELDDVVVDETLEELEGISR